LCIDDEENPVGSIIVGNVVLERWPLSCLWFLVWIAEKNIKWCRSYCRRFHTIIIGNATPEAEFFIAL
jgi:hypothetical protein